MQFKYILPVRFSTRVDNVPITWIPVFILKETRLGILQKLASETDRERREKLRAIVTDIETIIKQV